VSRARFPRDPKHGGQALATPVTCPKLGEYICDKQSFLPKLQARLAAYKSKEQTK
jgi:hypothetical protein